MATVIEGREAFVDRRDRRSEDQYQGPERRQFRDSHSESQPEVRELAEAVDQYKLRHRRRFITYEELHQVIADLGYHK